MQHNEENTALQTEAQQVQRTEKHSKAYILALIFFLLLLLLSGSFFLKAYIDKHKNINQNDRLASMVETTQTQTEYPDEPAEVLPQYRSLYAVNSDLIGWIRVPNTTINHPVVQTSDNDYYLHRDFETKQKVRHGRGTVFMDYRNDAKALDKNTVLYGHNYLDATMFSELEKYKDIEFYRQSPLIYFDTIYKEYTWKVFAVFLTTASPELDNGYVFNYIYPSMTDSNFAAYLQEIEKRTLYHTGVEVLPTDKILTLSTCTRDMDLRRGKEENARIVVLARLVRSGEANYTDVSKAEINKSPKYPQLWYDKHKQKNPYRADEKWYPEGAKQ